MPQQLGEIRSMRRRLAGVGPVQGFLISHQASQVTRRAHNKRRQQCYSRWSLGAVIFVVPGGPLLNFRNVNPSQSAAGVALDLSTIKESPVGGRPDNFLSSRRAGLVNTAVYQ